jgi:hypothetical protein
VLQLQQELLARVEKPQPQQEVCGTDAAPAPQPLLPEREREEDEVLLGAATLAWRAWGSERSAAALHSASRDGGAAVVSTAALNGAGKAPQEHAARLSANLWDGREDQVEDKRGETVPAGLVAAHDQQLRQLAGVAEGARRTLASCMAVVGGVEPGRLLPPLGRNERRPLPFAELEAALGALQVWS